MHSLVSKGCLQNISVPLEISQLIYGRTILENKTYFSDIYWKKTNYKKIQLTLLMRDSHCPVGSEIGKWRSCVGIWHLVSMLRLFSYSAMHWRSLVPIQYSLELLREAEVPSLKSACNFHVQASVSSLKSLFYNRKIISFVHVTSLKCGFLTCHF